MAGNEIIWFGYSSRGTPMLHYSGFRIYGIQIEKFVARTIHNFKVKFIFVLIHSID